MRDHDLRTPRATRAAQAVFLAFLATTIGIGESQARFMGGGGGMAPTSRGPAFGATTPVAGRYSSSSTPEGWNDRPLDRVPGQRGRAAAQPNGGRHRQPSRAERHYEPRHRHRAPVMTATPEPQPPVTQPTPAQMPVVAQPVTPPPTSTPPAMAARTASGAPAAGETRFLRDEILLTLTNEAAAAGLDEIADRVRLARIDAVRLDLIGRTVYRYRILDGRSVADAVRALEADARVATAQPNYLFGLAGDVLAGSQLGPAQYALDRLRLSETRRITQGEGAIVAVIDSGIDKDNVELAGSIADSFDGVGDAGGPDTHGTAVASILAAHTDLTGVAPRAKLLAIKAFGAAAGKAVPEGDGLTIAKGLQWAVDRKARVINMSFAGPKDPLLGDMIAAAHRRNHILVAAAGNDGAFAQPFYPGADPHVIAITSSDADDKLVAGATRAGYVELAAPGNDIVVAAPKGSYQFATGTSMAAAHVSGIAALLISQQPTIDADGVRALLVKTAHPLGAPGGDEDFGAGLIDAAAALDDNAPRRATAKAAPAE